MLTALIAGFGLLARWFIIASGLSRPSGTNIYFRLYALFEQPFLILLGAFALGTALLVVLSEGDRLAIEASSGTPLSATHVAVAAICLVGVGVGITEEVMHRLMLSMDEFSADFQARAFAQGQYAPPIPWPWRSLKDAIAPIFVQFHEDSGRWSSQYLPGYALLKAPFIRLGWGVWLNPLLTAGALIALAAVARRLWPGERARPAVALALMATSSQVLVTSGTGYSMPAHLFLNLVWLWLYLRRDISSWVCALAVGVLALGLHNPFPHALFAAPFLFRLLRERRWVRVGTAAFAYSAGALGWFLWLKLANPAVAGSESGLLHVFSLPTMATLVLHVMNVSLLLTWHAPLLGPLVLLAVAHPRSLNRTQQDLAMGIVATLLFFMLFPSTQGHGWGYRYAHQVIGSLCLVGADGLPRLTAAVGNRVTRAWLYTGFALALCVQIPLRLVDTARFVEPFVRGNAFVHSQRATVVLVGGDSIWYGQDLIRNDPFLGYPIVVRRKRLAKTMIEQIKQAFPGRVVDLSDRDLIALGMTPAVRWRSPSAEPRIEK